MGVKSEHPEYTAMKDLWEHCAIAASGHKAVQDAGTAILPKLADQTSTEYEAYKKRSTFFNATRRTIQGLSGMIFRKEATVVVPDSVKEMLNDIDMSGSSLHVLSQRTVDEALRLGRAGLFLDYPTVDTTNATMADAKRFGYRPMIKLYDAYSIINWKTAVVISAAVLSMVVLTEVKAKAKDEFQDDYVTQYRVLDLEKYPTTSGDAYRYRVRVFEVQKNEQGIEEDVVVDGPHYPTMNGKVMDFIPFQFIGPHSTSWEVCEPPLIDLVEVNLSHFRVNADYEHGCHFTGLPTPVISGYTRENPNDQFYIGSMSAWVFPNSQAKASYLEFTGQGLSALRTNLEDKKKEMAVLGARMLEAEPSAQQSANTAAIHRGGEQSMLASIAETVSCAMERMLKWFCDYANAASDEVKYKLNKDFFPMPMDSLTLTAIIAAWQNGAIDFDTMIDNLKSGEIVDQDDSAEDIQKRIKANPPPTQDVPTTPGDRAHNGPAKSAATGTTHKGGATSSNPTQTQMQHTKGN
jgi:hypothetical protein